MTEEETPMGEMQYFIEIIQPCRPTFPADGSEAEFNRVGEHFAYLQGLMAQGKLIMAGRREDAGFGMVILRAGSQEEAEALAAADPAIQAGLFLLREVKPFQVALWSAENVAG
jgi:uncharacterized protein